MIRLGVEEAGNPAGPPMIFLHGFLSCSAQWELNREALGEHHRLIMVELPGHGRSEAPTDHDLYGRDSVFAALESIREERGVEQWWAIGQSLGAAMMTRYALAYPERVCGLVITNSRAIFGVPRRGSEDSGSEDSGSEDSGSEIEDTRPQANFVDYESVRDLPYHPIHAKRLPAEVKDPLVVAADAMPRHVIELITSHRDSWASAHDFSALSVPVLLVNGRWESRFQPCVEIARAEIPELTVVDLEGGHAINAEQADGFNNAVLQFLRDNG